MDPVSVGAEHVLVDLAEWRALEEAHPEAEPELDADGPREPRLVLVLRPFVLDLRRVGLLPLRDLVVRLARARRARARDDREPEGHDRRDSHELLHGGTEVMRMRSTTQGMPAAGESVTPWTTADMTPLGSVMSPMSGT